MTRLKLSRAFYQRDTLTVARELLGCHIIRIKDGMALEMRITETEAYCGIEDKACHSYGGKRTERIEAMYKPGGAAYVYLIYGMYSCLNAVTEAEGNPCAVLIRGGEPIGDKDPLSLLRYGKPYSELSKRQISAFADGPGKLCLALGIDRGLNGADLTGDTLYIVEGERPLKINRGKRINIDYAEEARDFPWRFYIK